MSTARPHYPKEINPFRAFCSPNKLCQGLALVVYHSFGHPKIQIKNSTLRQNPYARVKGEVQLEKQAGD